MSCNYEKIEHYKSAFECFKQRFLVERKSIFRLDEEDEILDRDSIEYLFDNFINKGYEGSTTTATEKFFHQLTGKDFVEGGIEINDDVQKKAIEILAHAVWLWRLPASNTDTKNRKKSIIEILKFNKDWQEDNLIDNYFFKNNYTGFALPGIGYNTNKANELAYIIKFFKLYLTNQDEFVQEEFFKKNRTVGIKTTHEYNKKNNKYERKELRTNKSEKTKVSVPNALLHLINPKNYERIIADNHKEKIKKVFSPIFNIEENDVDKAIYQIKEKILNLIKANDSAKREIDFYDNSIVRMWQSDLDFRSKNIIIHGAPGTGKTFLTEEAIKTRQLIEKKSEYRLVQFHPSYSYEDFIEGIRPIKMHASGQMEFSLKNGIFKQMCIDAFNELIKVYEEGKGRKPKKYYFIADEINRAELSRVFGELLLCLEDDKRLSIQDGKVIGTKIQTQYSNLWNDNDDYIVVRVDKNDQLSSEGEGYFGVPENIYFIGTMNDIDRSVESFDMALRRRFVWKHYKFDDFPILEHYKKIVSDNEKIDEYITLCKNLNKFITSDKGLGLSSSYELGHSYFMKPKKLTKDELDRCWDEHIEPIFIEYLRSEYEERKIEKKLKEAKKIFKFG